MTTHVREVQASPGTIRLAGKTLSVIGMPSVQDLARFQSKITFGDYSFDSDPLLSAYSMSSFAGGIGNEKLKEGVDDETYWTGTLETRYPGMVALGAKTWAFGHPTITGIGVACPLGDFPAIDPAFWASFDARLTRWNEATRAFVDIGPLTATPVNKAVEYDNVLWVPLGAAGYATVTAAGGITVSTAIGGVVAFCLWDDQVAALTTDGKIRFFFAATGWAAHLPGMVLPSGHRPRNLVVFINQQQTPTIHVVTSQDVWALDRANDKLYRTQLQFPKHPDQGLGSTNWRGESLYVSVGIGVHAYNGGIISSMGPDGRYGLPAGLRGAIVDLEPEYNALIATIEGEPAPSDDPQAFEIVPTAYDDDDPYLTSIEALSCLLRWVQSGWHPVWQSPTATGVPSWALVSSTADAYRLWWGYGGDLHYQKLPRGFHNPKVGVRAGLNEFAETGFLTTGWFDADMPAFRKLGSHCELVMDDALGTGEPTGTIMVAYQVDNDPSWRSLGTAQQVGRSVFPFVPAERESSDTFSIGQEFGRIRFRLEFARPEDRITYSPIMALFLLKFIKLPLSSLSFRFTINLTQDRDFMGGGPGEVADFIRLLASGDEFYELIHRDQAYRVRVAQTQTSEATGYDQRSSMTISCVGVEVPPERLRPIPAAVT